MIDPLTQKYLEVLTEGKNNNGTVKGEKNKPGKSFEGTEKLNKEKNTSTKNAKVQKPTEDKRNSTSSRDGKMENCKKVVTDSINSFEELYNKVLKEDDSFGWSIQDDTEEGDGDESSTESEYEFDSGEMDNEGEGEGEGEEETETEGEEVTITLDKDTAQKLIDILQAAVGGMEDSEEDTEEDEEDEESGEDEEDLFSGVSDEEDEEDETLTKEEVDAEIVGHSLVDQEKLLKGMNKPANGVVKGAISAKKKKAQVPLTGKGFKGELSPQGDKGKVLQGKNNKVPAVNAGNKSFFDNK